MFSENLDSSALPGGDAFTVNLDGQSNPTVSSLKCDGGNLLILRLDHTLSQNDALTLSYTDPATADDSNALQDVSGNDVATFTDQAIHNETPASGDNVAPTIDSVNASGNTVILTLSEEFNVFESGSMSDFLVTDSDNNQLTITNYLRNSGDSGSTIELTLDSALTSGETITVEYTDPNPGDDDTDAVQDLSGNDLASVTKTVTVGGSMDLLSAVQSKSLTISGIDHDTLVPLDNYIVEALYEGDSWLNYQDASDPVTYSFNETLPDEYSGSDTYGWQPVASHVRDVIDEVMANTDGVILPDIEKASSGQIRFNMVETDGDTAAYAYFPGSGVGGDVFLGNDIGSDSETGNVEPYGVGRSDIVHELGHALGLTHPFVEDGVDRSNPPLPAAEDHSANTVMSYTDYRR